MFIFFFLSLPCLALTVSFSFTPHYLPPFMVEWLWCDGSLDRSLMGDPLSYILVPARAPQKAWLCYPVCAIVHIKDPLLLIKKSSLCSRGQQESYLVIWVVLYYMSDTSFPSLSLSLSVSLSLSLSPSLPLSLSLPPSLSPSVSLCHSLPTPPCVIIYYVYMR